MNRRSFLKSMGCAAAAAVVGPRAFIGAPLSHYGQVTATLSQYGMVVTVTDVVRMTRAHKKRGFEAGLS